MDALIENHGSIVLLRPLSDAAEAWLEENVAEDALRFGGAVVCEPRYVEALCLGMTEDGLVLEVA